MKPPKVRAQFRKVRVQKKIFGTDNRPRLSVYRSLKHVYAQIINDLQGKTLVSASSNQKESQSGSGLKKATIVGEQIAKKALAKGVKQVVFDRGARPYHGRVKAVAEGARKGGLKF